VKENDFLGFQKIKTDKTIENYEKAFRSYRSAIEKNKTELETKSKQIFELSTKIDNSKKEVQLFKNKISILLTDPTVFASEKKKYFDGVMNILEKEIKLSRYRFPKVDRADKQTLISEMGKIAEKVSEENHIPFAAFNEIFKDSENSVRFLSLLRFGNDNLNYNNEDIPIEKKKRGRRI